MKNEREYWIELFQYPYPADSHLNYHVIKGAPTQEMPHMIHLIGPIMAHSQREAVAVALYAAYKPREEMK